MCYGRKKGGSSMKGITPGGAASKRHGASMPVSDNTRNEIPGTQQMKGEYTGIKRRPASVDFPNQSASSNRDLDFKRMMNRENAEMWAKGGGGIFSDKYAKQRLHDSGYDMVSRPGPLNELGKKLDAKIAKGPKKPQAKPQSEMKMLRSVKGLEPKKKLMATRTMAKIKKKPLEKMTPKPAKKINTTKSGGSMGASNGDLRKQKRTQKKVDKAIKKGKMLNIAVESEDRGIHGNFKLDPRGVTVGKGGYVADTDQNFSLTNSGVVKLGNHNYSKNIKEPYKLYANQDLVGRIGKKVNFKKRNKK